MSTPAPGKYAVYPKVYCFAISHHSTCHCRGGCVQPVRNEYSFIEFALTRQQTETKPKDHAENKTAYPSPIQTLPSLRRELYAGSGENYRHTWMILSITPGRAMASRAAGRGASRASRPADLAATSGGTYSARSSPSSDSVASARARPPAASVAVCTLLRARSNQEGGEKGKVHGFSCHSAAAV